MSGFTGGSLWDDFLVYHYAVQEGGVSHDPAAAPADGKKAAMRISGISLSESTITAGETVIMQAGITGKQIAYIYLFVGYVDEESGALLIADRDFIEADNVKEVNGIYYPDWPADEPILLEFEWEPYLYSLYDGKRGEFCLLQPSVYGSKAEDAEYTVAGIYHTAEKQKDCYAVMDFDAAGRMLSLYGYSGMEPGGAIHEIKPKTGAGFTILNTWLEETAQGERYVREEGGTLFFGKTGIEWYDYEAFPGEYRLGFIVEDFDGNRVAEYARLIIE